MRSYMPGLHRNYLENQLSRPKVSHSIDKLPDEVRGDVEVLFKECIKLLFKFRKFHYGIVQDYVKKFNSNTGTGGTDINKNLKEYINNTKKKLDSQDEEEYLEHSFLMDVLFSIFVFLLVSLYIHILFTLIRGWQFIIESSFNTTLPNLFSVIDYNELY